MIFRVYGGIINRDRLLGMETLLSRLCRGNYIIQVDEMMEPIISKEVGDNILLN